jgi:hypothetical protein
VVTDREEMRARPPDTVQQARKIHEKAAQTIIDAVKGGTLTLNAALPLTELDKGEQPAALEEAKQVAETKAPTATVTRSVVSRKQVVAIVQEQMAAGTPAHDAVQHAFEKHEVVEATPALADAVARATGRQVVIPATDGLLHSGRTKEETAQIKAHTKRIYQIIEPIEGLAALEDLQGLVEAIPDFMAHRITRSLSQAETNLAHFASLWRHKTC